eukprot:CAMPEP_0113504410 /NCGR_PEP_ID=MMETSP0014_2-20120614/34701_1 /TAXON_ID=2857 /ORGANISM="Nitzschia sp." /LENGTH=489 /DNA_ID=CAMNT_0000399519 /DNA_START=64 /DNA_END=1530 /DNA_ORIENTATION=+ /assembly_acc=CAM_ASM_000159
MHFKKISVLLLFVAVIIGAKECVGATSRSSSLVASDLISSSSGGKKSHPTFATSTTKVTSTKDINKIYHSRHHAVSVRGGGRDDDDGKASMLSSVFNLVNNVAGAGILTLSVGMASGTGYVPAMAICAFLGAMSCHSFAIIGDACELMGEKDFKGLWKRTISPGSTYIVDAAIAIMCLACSIIYSGILGDVFTPLLEQAGLPAQFNGRTSNILVITGFFLLPLSLIKDLSALAFTSILGFLSIAYTVFFIVVRALDGSYSVPDGKFLQDGLIPILPTFEKTSLWNMDFTSLVLASNLGLAYIAHYNAPAFYRSLKNTNSKRFGVMVGISFTILVLLYIATMVAGYSTFGDVCQGNILLNYHPSDFLSTLGRLATGFSILFGFPLVASGARESIIGVASSLGNNAVGSDKNHFLLVAGILAFVTAIACTVKDVSLVVGITGAALGSFIVYMIPPVIYSNAVSLSKGSNSPEAKSAKVNLLLVPFGLCIAF